RGDGDVLAVPEHDRLREIADAELRPLQVGNERDRPAGLLLRLAHALHALGVVGLRTVRQVEAHGVHAGGHELAQVLRRSRRRPEGRDDLRAALVDHEIRVALGKAPKPGYTAREPSCSSMRSSWLYFATRSLRAGAPVLI